MSRIGASSTLGAEVDPLLLEGFTRNVARHTNRCDGGQQPDEDQGVVTLRAVDDDLRPELPGVDVGRDGGEAAEEGAEGEGGEGHGGEPEDVVGPAEGEDGREAEQ